MQSYADGCHDLYHHGLHGHDLEDRSIDKGRWTHFTGSTSMFRQG